ncbi:MAG: aldo/keto reductase [Dehalococcoidales bacterium]|nr:MAG: aldo/keto reductase [Dehalococcoidales bacterium]
MEKRRLGKTGHMSSILALGGAALGTVTQAEADAAITLAMEHGINHIDVAPSYGDAELRIGPWMPKHRNDFFLGCKTTERDKTGAWESIKRSMDRLKVSNFDLFQFHGVDDLDTLEKILNPGGALEAVLEARQQGLVNYVGITGHRPHVYVEALKRFDFDTVLFPLSRVHAAHFNKDNDFRPLLDSAQQNGVGLIAIKAISKRVWPSKDRSYQTWYEPFDSRADVARSIGYTLSQGVTTCPMPSDVQLWPKVIEAAEEFTPMTVEEQTAAVDEVALYQPISSPREALGR